VENGAEQMRKKSGGAREMAHGPNKGMVDKLMAVDNNGQAAGNEALSR
jgi:hypothetical protein